MDTFLVQDHFWTGIGTAAAVLTSFGFVPQILKMHRSQSAEDVSVLTLYQFAAGIALWELYGWYLKDPVIIVANFITLSTVVMALVLYYRIQARHRRQLG